jgi:hypothetical protein
MSQPLVNWSTCFDRDCWRSFRSRSVRRWLGVTGTPTTIGMNWPKASTESSSSIQPVCRVKLYPLAKYDCHMSSYTELTWIECTGPEVPASHAFVGFRTSHEPFDRLCIIQVDPESGESGESIEVPWRDHGFVLRRGFPEGAAELVTAVQADW